MKAILTIGLLILSNSFMVLAWYGHLKFHEWKWFNKLGLVSIILISWGIALFEYIFQVPANKIGFRENGGPFSLIQLKVIQEVITLVVLPSSPWWSSKRRHLGPITSFLSFSWSWRCILCSKNKICLRFPEALLPIRHCPEAWPYPLEN